MKRSFLLLTFAFFSFGAFAQLQVDNQLQMTGTNNTEKQITGVGNPGGADHAVNAGNVQSGSLLYAAAAGSGGNYTITLSPAPSAYAPGMIVNFLSNHNNASTVTINVNGLGAKTLKKAVTQDLASGDILSGQAVSAIYDGTNFQMLSGSGSTVSSAISLIYTTKGF